MTVDGLVSLASWLSGWLAGVCIVSACGRGGVNELRDTSKKLNKGIFLAIHLLSVEVCFPLPPSLLYSRRLPVSRPAHCSNPCPRPQSHCFMVRSHYHNIRLSAGVHVEEVPVEGLHIIEVQIFCWHVRQIHCTTVSNIPVNFEKLMSEDITLVCLDEWCFQGFRGGGGGRGSSLPNCSTPPTQLSPKK